LSNQAVFCVNGGWLDIEMSNYKSKNMEFIKTPVISSLVERLSFKTDAELRQVIDFVDEHPNEGDNTGRPSFASEADVQIVREARQAAYQGGGGGLTLVPSWSKNIDTAKDFLTYMLSDKGLRIYYEATGGGILPMKTSDGKYPEVKMSTFRRNQMEIFAEGFLVNLSKAGTNRLYSIAGVSTTYNNGLMGVPGVLLRTNSGTIAERVNEIMSTNQQTVSNKWSSIEPLL
jgi:ABC-type glycerol-3-phosphate transport system substrate-binding protein